MDNNLSHVKAVKAIVNPLDGKEIILTPAQGGRARAFTKPEWEKQMRILTRAPHRRGKDGFNWIYVEDIPAPEPGDRLSIEKTGGAELACMKREKEKEKKEKKD